MRPRRRAQVLLLLRSLQIQSFRTRPMVARCVHKISRSATRASSLSSTSHKSARFLSSHEPGWKATDDGASFGLKPWQRNFLIGATAGLVATQGYLYYDAHRKKSSFVAYSLVKRDPVSPTASIFCLEPKEASQDFEVYREAWRKGIWNVQFKQPQIQIVRAYTPLPPLEDAKADVPAGNQLRFLIRHDPHGEVSSYLHKLPIGSEIELRGPNLEYHLSPEVKQVVFFAGGTGIAPALQIAHAMFDGEQNKEGDTDGLKKGRKLHILWANRSREDCVGGQSDDPPSEVLPPKPTWSGLFTQPKSKPVAKISDQKGHIVQELEKLKQKYPGQVTVEYFVNTEDTWIDEDAVVRALSRFDDRDFSTRTVAPQEQRQILISGPSGFISYLAGPKEWRNGREEQGSVSKLIAHAIARNPHRVQVWKI